MSRPSAASEAFRKCSADLIKVIPDQGLLVLAWELYSAGVVSKPAVEGLSPIEKKTKLLSAVGDQIDVEPSKFQNLLQALRKQPPLKEMADKLETIYKECVPQMSELTVSQQIPPRAETQMSPPPPPSTISDHPSSPPPSLEPVEVTSSPPHPHLQPHSAATPELSMAAIFAIENRQAIAARFADFQTKVCNKLSKNGVSIEEFRVFVTNQFHPGDCIPPRPASLTEIFEAITHHGLWDYFHYSPLVRIAEKFGEDDSEMKDWVQTYMNDLKAYQLVTTVEDYIEALLDDPDAPPSKRAKYDPRYYSPVEWKTKFNDHSLQYLADVWKKFSGHYLMPDSPPTALLDRVREGCFSVTWLVPSALIPSLTEKAKIDTEFFQKHHILKVTVGDQCVYEEVTETKTSEPEQNIPSSNVQLPKVTDWKDTFGGYDCKFVTPPMSAFQTECPICRLILRDPYQARCCGTDFCRSCIERLPTDNTPCPYCKTDNIEVFKDKRLKHSLSQLQVWCTHNKDGCKWSGELGELEDHLKTGVHSATQLSPNIPDVSEVGSTTRCDSRYKIDPQRGGLLCDLECMIIGSFGDEHAPGVRAIPKKPLKPGGSYLPGFRQDLETIQSLIRKDPSKTLSYIFVDFPGEECQRPKGEYLQKIEEFLQECSTPGAMIWYTGHGEEGTGNWCFKDGVISFEEVFDLYKRHYRGKLLGLICDCCFAGHWIQRCGETLDSMGIGACGHQARQNGILIKVLTACKQDEKAHDTYYTSNVVIIKEGRLTFLAKQDVSPTQTQLSMDFTRSRCFNKPEESCRLHRIPSALRWNWKDLIIDDQYDRLNNCIRIVKGKDKGRQTWHLAIVFEHQLEEFWAAVKSGHIDIADYGHSIFSGWGKEPSAETRKLWTTYGPILF